MTSQFDQIRPFDGQRRLPAAAGRRGIPAFWKRQFHTWHWMSSAICLVGMLLFAITGITLNHAGAIEGRPVVTTEERTMPADVLDSLEAATAADGADVPVPQPVSNWLSGELGVSTAGRAPEWSDAELYIALPRPGGDGWVSIDRGTGEVLYETTDRGWIAYFNDLHKGRDTGPAWSWFIDIFAVICVVFSLTGFLLLQLHARKRPMTWPTVGAGVIVPFFILIFLMH